MDSFEKMAVSMFGGSKLFGYLNKAYPDDALEIMVELARATVQDNKEFVDNYRVNPDTPEGEKNHRKMQRKGCCGYFDTAIKCTSGNKYLIGFNYGH